MIVMVLCCNILCGCLDVDNTYLQCPQSLDGVTVQFVEACKGDKQPLECECIELRKKQVK